jgi:hypothetical protein
VKAKAQPAKIEETGQAMDMVEYNKLLPEIPAKERKAFQAWFVEHQDFVTWEQFKKQGYQRVVEVKEDIEKHILQVTGKPQQLKLAFMPNEMARTSPFFPMSRAEMKDRPLYQDFIIENRWGRISITGPRLSIGDESVLLALLVLAKRHKNDKFKTSCAELCEVMGITRGKNQYAAISVTLDRLVSAAINTELYKTESEKKEIARWIKGTILSNVDFETETGKIEVTLNPYFLGLYAANLTTSLDVSERSKLKGDTSKAMYRFIQTHKPGAVPFGLLTLSLGLNLNVDQPLFELRRQIRTAISELKKHGHIKDGKIDKSDNVHFIR